MQPRGWQQNTFWEFKSGREAMAHGFYTVRVAMQAFPVLCMDVNPPTETRKGGRCLQCAV